MTTIERLARWKEEGAIADEQFVRLDALASKRRFSVYTELHALLYVGVLAIGAGLLWTVQTYFQSLGDVVIVLALSLTLAGCAYYGVSRARPYSSGEVESPSHSFDYVLYLGCVVFGILLGYLESRFGVLGEAWDWHVLVSAVVFLLAAYRFDNRLVLSLALSTLAAWFGIKVSRFGIDSGDTLRLLAIAYGLVVAGLGTLTYRLAIKAHFFETYLHLAATAIFVALLTGVGDHRAGTIYLLALIALGAATVTAGVRSRRFAFVAYGVLYPYLGVSMKAIEHMNAEATMAYGVVSGGTMIVLLVVLSRRFGAHE